MTQEKKEPLAPTRTDANIVTDFQSTKGLDNYSSPRSVISTHVPGFANILNNSKIIDKPKYDASKMAPADELLNFPNWHLPEDLKEVIEYVAKGYNVTPDIPTAAMFSAAGAALGKTIKGHSGNHTNHPFLWFVIVGPKALGKSKPVEFFYSPLVEADNESARRYNQELNAWKAAPKDQRGDPPMLMTRVCQNATDERVFHKLAQNGGALAWVCDEFGTLMGGMGRYSSGGNSMMINNLLSLHTGLLFSRETVGDEALRVEAPAVTIMATTQPATIKKLMTPHLENGFFERFCYIRAHRLTEVRLPSKIPDEATRTWRDYIDRLTRNQVSDIYENNRAQEIHNNALLRWQTTSLGADDDTIASIYTKANYVCCRLLPIVARLRNENVIDAPTMLYSVDCTDFLINHQIRVYLEMRGPIESQLSKKEVGQFLLEKGLVANKSKLAGILGVSKSAVTQWGL